MATTLNINGRDHSVDAAPGTPLLWVLRDHLQMFGTKYGCGVAQCGACTVHVNGRPVRACVTPHNAVADAKIVTIEGVQGAAADAVRAAWEKIDVPQCGYCQSGQIMSAVVLLAEQAAPDDAAIDAAMSGNLCRCATYPKIRAAIKDAAARLHASTGTDARGAV